MKMSIFCLIFIVCILLSVFAGEQQIITVLDFATTEVSKGEMMSVISLLSSSLFQTGKYVVIDVAQREALLQEIEFAATDCTDEACQIEIGKMLAAEMVVVGSMSKVGTKFIVSAKMLETATSRTVNTADGIYPNLDALVEDIMPLARRLAGMPTAVAEVPKEEIEVAPEVVEEEAAPPVISEEEVKPKRRKVTFQGVLKTATLIAGVGVGGAGAYFLYDAFSYMNGPVEDAFQSYDTADADFDTLYETYLTEFDTYSGKLYLGAGIVAGGVAFLLTSLILFILPEKNVEPEEEIAFYVLPDSRAVALSFNISY